MSEANEPARNHHPICVFAYQRALKKESVWDCLCCLLNEYETSRPVLAENVDWENDFDDKTSLWTCPNFDNGGMGEYIKWTEVKSFIRNLLASRPMEVSVERIKNVIKGIYDLRNMSGMDRAIISEAIAKDLKAGKESVVDKSKIKSLLNIRIRAEQIEKIYRGYKLRDSIRDQLAEAIAKEMRGNDGN